MKVLQAEWGPYESGEEKRVQHRYENAMHCVLAVQQAIEDINMFAKTPDDPPATLRAYHFGRRVCGEAIIELDNALRMDFPAEPSGPQGSLKEDFGPNP